MIRFTFHQQGQAHPEKPRTAGLLLMRARFKLARAQGPFTIERDNNDAEGPDRSVREALRILKGFTHAARIGARLDIHAQNTVFTVRTLQVAPQITAPQIAPELVPVYVYVFGTYPFATNLGNWYCRFIAGTQIVSRHGYFGPPWYGAAQDFGAATGDQLLLVAHEIVRKATTKGDAFYGKIATVIVHDLIWTRDGGWGHYSGIYHLHVHVDVDGGQACSP